MKLHPYPQGSDAWHQARCGVCTASTFADAVSVLSRASGDKVKGDPTAASDEMAGILAIERISKTPYRKLFDTPEMLAGREQEPFARAAYESRTRQWVDESGLVTTDDGLFGYSTDGFVGAAGAIEVKMLVTARRIAEFMRCPDKREFIAEFVPQCNGGLWLTGRQWIDLVVWIPQLESVGKHLNIFRIERDDNAITELEGGLVKFIRRVDALERMFRAPTTDVPPWDASPEIERAAARAAELVANPFA